MKEITMTGQDWIHVLSDVSKRIEAEKDRLNELDGAIGDGDHGVAMAIGFRAVDKSLVELKGEATINRVFQTAGQAFLTAAGGAVGPLIGSMFCETGKAFNGRVSFGAQDAVWMFEVMEQAMVRRGKAQLGDKTMLDALHPAVEAVKCAEGEDMVELFHRAADAAASGARSTGAMISRLGRSSRLGERTIGHEDPGANSIALVLRAIEESVAAL